MFVYRIADLLDSLNQARSDGFEYVEISILPPDDSVDNESIDLNYVDAANDSEEDQIDSILLPSNYINPHR